MVVHTNWKYDGNMMKYEPKIGLDIWTLVRYHALGYRSTSGVHPQVQPSNTKGSSQELGLKALER
jgi:hypothetical protein